MRTFARPTAAVLAAAIGLIPALAEAQPRRWYPPPGGPAPGWHHGPPPGVSPPPPGVYNGPPRGAYYRPAPRHWRDARPDPGAAIAAGIIGLAAGAIIAGSASQNRHVQRCLNTYRSYDPSSDTYVGRDGRRRLCRL